MRVSRDIALISVFCALLIGAQFVLSFISGVEVVTVLFLTFAYVFGAKRGMLLGVAFSLTRGLVFGFFPTVIMLYLVYYPLFALAFGALGNKFERKFSGKILMLLTLFAILFTVFFTLLDDVITPLYYAYSWQATKAYAYASLFTCIPQTICVCVTVLTLFPLLHRICIKYRK